MSRPKKLTPELLATVPELLARGLRKPEIAKRFGCKPSSLQVLCSQAKISLRPGGERTAICLISRGSMTAFRKRAAAMGYSETQLASDLLEMIARDDLYDAVLDAPKPRSEEFEDAS